MKRFLTLTLICVMLLSLFVACKPAETDDDWLSGNNDTPNTTDTPGDTTNTPADGNNAGSTDTPGDTTNTPDNGNTSGGNNTAGGNNAGSNDTGNNDTGNNNAGNNNAGNNNPGTTIEGNPLLSANKTYNSAPALSYELDPFGLCKTAKMTDLDGKTLTLYTGADYAMWGYNTTSNQYVNEWEWFREAKKLYGVNIKYIRSVTGSTSVIKAFQAMSAGKDCDLITTHIGSFPYICNVMAPLENYYNTAKIGDMPGLDPAISTRTKWKGNTIVIGPRLVNGVLNYNRTYVKGEGLDDPYELYKSGKWNWTTFKKYMLSLPETDKSGRVVYGCATWSQFWYWANTNATPCFEIDTTTDAGVVKNNLDSTAVKETFVWLEGVCDAGGKYFDGNASDSFHGADKTKRTVMMYGSAGVDLENVADSMKKDEFFWVPFPKNEKNSKAVNHVEIYGFGIGLPRKTNKEGNRAAAAKFAELWCSRYTETRYDYLRHRCKWSFEQVKELYDVGAQNGMLGMGSGVGNMVKLTTGTTTNFNKSVTDPSLSVSTCLAKLSPLAKKEVEAVLKFGIQ